MKLSDFVSRSLFPTVLWSQNESLKDQFVNGATRLAEAIAQFLTHSFPEYTFETASNYAVGKIAAVPWIGIHLQKENFDASSQSGVYGTILFSADGSGAWLSLQVGVSVPTLDPKEVRSMSASLRKPAGFTDAALHLQLEHSGRTNVARPKKYERASVIGKAIRFDQEIDSHLYELTSFYLNFYHFQNGKINVPEEDYQDEVINLEINDDNYNDVPPPISWQCNNAR